MLRVPAKKSRDAWILCKATMVMNFDDDGGDLRRPNRICRLSESEDRAHVITDFRSGYNALGINDLTKTGRTQNGMSSSDRSGDGASLTSAGASPISAEADV